MAGETSTLKRAPPEGVGQSHRAAAVRYVDSMSLDQQTRTQVGLAGRAREADDELETSPQEGHPGRGCHLRAAQRRRAGPLGLRRPRSARAAPRGARETLPRDRAPAP